MNSKEEVDMLNDDELAKILVEEPNNKASTHSQASEQVQENLAEALDGLAELSALDQLYERSIGIQGQKNNYEQPSQTGIMGAVAEDSALIQDVGDILQPNDIADELVRSEHDYNGYGHAQ